VACDEMIEAPGWPRPAPRTLVDAVQPLAIVELEAR
jgi:hypothetical protein